MQVQSVPIEKVKPYGNNPRDNQEAVRHVEASLRRYGFRQPIVVDKDFVIVAGHTRWEAARQIGFKEIPVHVAEDLTADEIAAYRLVDNKTAEFSLWETEKFWNEFETAFNGKPDEEISEMFADMQRDIDGEGEQEAAGVGKLDQAVQLLPAREYVVIVCDGDGGEQFGKLKELFDLKPVRRGGYKEGSPFDDVGTQRVIRARDVLENYQRKQC